MFNNYNILTFSWQDSGKKWKINHWKDDKIEGNKKNIISCGILVGESIKSGQDKRK